MSEDYETEGTQMDPDAETTESTDPTEMEGVPPE